MSDKNKVAVVTGAGQGIGRAIAERLALDGFTLVINDINPEKAREVSDSLKDRGHDAIVVPGDVSKQDQVNTMVDRVMEEFGHLDVMVANAGVIRIAPMMETSEADLDFLHAVNVKGVLWCAQAAARQMIKQGHGKIITAGSTAGHTGSVPLMGAYSASKFHVRGLVQALATELAPHGVTVNSYCPGIVATPMWDQCDEDIGAITGAEKGQSFESTRRLIPLGRHQQPADVANIASFLASSDSDYITGQSYMTNGGAYMV